MTRLDYHVMRVQNKLALRRFVQALAWTLMGFAAAVWIAILVERVFGYQLPRQMTWFWAGLGAAGVLALVYAIVRRPSRHLAAVAIDDELKLKEKFSTALYIRGDADPFAAAAVRDAERTAQDVNLHKRFPLFWPRPAYATLMVAILAFATGLFLKPMDLFGRQEAQQRAAIEQRRVDAATKNVERALATVTSIPKAAANEDTIRNARIELEQLLNEPIRDPGHANRTALKAMQDVQKAIAEQIEKNRAYVEGKNDARLFRSMQPPSNERGPVADAQRAIAQGSCRRPSKSLTRCLRMRSSARPSR
jgi:hypothetical protein